MALNNEVIIQLKNGLTAQGRLTNINKKELFLTVSDCITTETIDEGVNLQEKHDSFTIKKNEIKEIKIIIYKKYEDILREKEEKSSKKSESISSQKKEPKKIEFNRSGNFKANSEKSSINSDKSSNFSRSEKSDIHSDYQKKIQPVNLSYPTIYELDDEEDLNNYLINNHRKKIYEYKVERSIYN
jgi:small nuclear ribonucleoprotein (snRNP)-like protein